VTVTGENDAPVVTQSIANQSGREGQAFSFALPAGVFADVDQGDVLTYSLSLANGAPLPSWLSFDPATRMMTGTPGGSDAAELSLKVTATDQAGLGVSTVFGLSIADGACTGGGIFNGTGQSDNINGTECADVINGNGGDDQLYGNGGHDVLNGGLGVDRISGGVGNDEIQMSIDALWGRNSFTANQNIESSCDTPSRVSLQGMNRTKDIVDGGAGWDTYAGTSGHDAIILDTGSGSQAAIRDIEQFDLAAGNDVLNLTSARFDYGGVVVIAGSGNDTVWTADGSDRIYGGSGRDTIDAGAGDDFVDGGDQDDALVSLLGYGNDIVRGGAGNDKLADLSGQNLLDGGAGTDLVIDGNGDSILLGGKGNDVLKLGRGRDIVLFNRGDGRDTVVGGNECDANDTLVLGGGIRYQDLSFKRDGADLILNIGPGDSPADSIRLADWYEGNRTIDRLEIVIDASSDYMAGSADTLRNRRFQSFDFEALVARYNDETNQHGCWGGYATSQPWALSAALVAFHLGGSDTRLMGGDIADYSAHQGSLNGLSLGVAQAALGQSSLGYAAQEISPLDVQTAGAMRL
jgi:Ca2+-binding RTX toxin-like protein